MTYTDPSQAWPGLPVQMGVPIQLPPVIKPLVYCEFRPNPESLCAVFACEAVEEMQFCFKHAQDVKDALSREVT